MPKDVMAQTVSDRLREIQQRNNRGGSSIEQRISEATSASTLLEETLEVIRQFGRRIENVYVDETLGNIERWDIIKEFAHTIETQAKILEGLAAQRLRQLKNKPS